MRITLAILLIVLAANIAGIVVNLRLARSVARRDLNMSPAWHRTQRWVIRGFCVVGTLAAILAGYVAVTLAR